MVTSGEIDFTLHFMGPKGVKFPHLYQAETSLQGAFASKNLVTEMRSGSAQGVFRNDEHRYSDEDIKKAFTVLDLDKNGYIGASELKHILINMGELITDEEVDMMVSILDPGGHGQVNFHQFAVMVNSPADSLEILQDVSEVSVGNEQRINKSDSNNEEEEKSSYKRKLISSFVGRNKILKDDIHSMCGFFLEKGGININDSGDELEWNIRYDVFCKIVPSEITGETKELFDLLKGDDSKSRIDMRELLLSLCNFIPMSTQERCELISKMYERNGSYIAIESDIASILAANHLKSKKAVARKAETVMKFLQSSEGHLSLINLQDIAAKFPNLLFPKYRMN